MCVPCAPSPERYIGKYTRMPSVCLCEVREVAWRHWRSERPSQPSMSTSLEPVLTEASRYCGWSVLVLCREASSGAGQHQHGVRRGSR